MKFSVLSSGSGGNSLLIESHQTRILIDAGLSGKQMTERLLQVGVDPSTLSAILVTHEHIDHVKGVGILARRYQLPVYMNEPTWQQLPTSVGIIPNELKRWCESGSAFDIADLHIQSIPISHDAAEPMAFSVHTKEASLAIVTDLGYVSGHIMDAVSGVDTLIWESNHDTQMLLIGDYPWNVKRRILSDTGHLSNADAGEALARIVRGNGEQVYLAHLSRDNNLDELAHLTVKHVLEETGYTVGKNVHLRSTYQDRPTPLTYCKAPSHTLI